jgi:hypothetical protein
VFAIVLAFAFCPLPEAGPEGVRGGNRPAALPPGLNAGLVLLLGRYGRLRTGSGEVVVTGVPTLAGAAVTATVADATGSFGRRAALAVTVSWTDFTADAVAGTVTFAITSRRDERASTAPRSHDGVASLLPQPKLKFGVTLAGEAVRRTMASGTLPPCVQALTTHRADCPRLMEACSRCAATQRLTLAVCGTESEYAVSVAPDRTAAAAELELLGFPGEGELAFPDVVGDGSAAGRGEVVAGLGVAAVPLALGVGVLEVAIAVGVAVGVDVGVDRVGVGLGVGDGLGGGAGSRSGSHP